MQIFGSSYWNENQLYGNNMSNIWTPIYYANSTSTSSSMDGVEYSIETDDGSYVVSFETAIFVLRILIVRFELKNILNRFFFLR